ncbi:MAG TPA: hypothetical protein VG982_03135 [Candidatus Paceibacterota bacterium]|nr:hypothetical protein [Candidatus Paceibacterota bacterium]
MTTHTNGSEGSEAQEIENWRNEHGSPDFTYLQSLAAEDTVESMNKLKSIADDLDVDYPSEISAHDLVDKIRSASGENEDGNPNQTS